MRQFMVQFRSLRDIQDFVALASALDVQLTVGNDRFQVNATSFMGLFALNCRNPLTVNVECSEEDFRKLLTTFERFLAE